MGLIGCHSLTNGYVSASTWRSYPSRAALSHTIRFESTDHHPSFDVDPHLFIRLPVYVSAVNAQLCRGLLGGERRCFFQPRERW